MNQWLAGIIVGAIAAAFTYLIAIRRASGRVETTEASELWEEAREMRDDYRKQLETALILIDKLRDRIGELEKINTDLQLQLLGLLRRVDDIENGGTDVVAHVYD
jgi:hypothetical protein